MKFPIRSLHVLLLFLALPLVLIGCGLISGSSSSPSNQPPNILFVIMDDVGIDQMQAFGYGGSTPPSMPNMTAVAGAGVRFRNAWSMPECTPGRASMFVGRYPFRTNNFAALGPYDLANSQISPYEMTTPKLLKQANYESAMFGKFHLAGPDNNQAGNGTPLDLGWDYFYGWIRGGPASIDTTAGGVAATKTYGCGFVTGVASGACYFSDNTCSNLPGPSSTGDVPGKQCLVMGGIFKPSSPCQTTPPSDLNFNRANAYYVSPLVIESAVGVEIVPISDSRSRGYRTSIETSAAISWINSRPSARPWMATVSYSAAHTPYQQPPGSLAGNAGGDDLSCSEFTQQRVLSNKMTEALDTEFGRLLVETGLATRNSDGTLAYDPKASNTVIVIVGDNGTFANAVKDPFDISRAKATAYQTGVWVPLIVSGPMVAEPNREVNHMVNMVDVFRLFGEIAGIDVPSAVPRTIDAAPLLPYLTKADQASIRSVNFTQGGYNVQANGQRNGACVVKTVIGGKTVASICTQSVFDKGPCEDNAGVWWGPGYTDPEVLTTVNPPSTGYRNCCQVNQAQFKAGRALTPIAPEITIAVRNDSYKLVRNTIQTYNQAADTCSSVTTNEFYEIDQSVPTPKLDKAALNLVPSMGTWSAALLAAYNNLLSQLNAILASQPACPGDGNIDGVVNAQDSINLQTVSQTWGLSSVYDWNLDGLTNIADQPFVSQNLGNCPPSTAVY
jgi:arylsulfatase A-like enzyme